MVSLHDATADRQTDPGAVVHAAPVQALERPEDPVAILRIEADTVVHDLEAPHVPVTLGAHLHGVATIVRVELERVAEQVLKELPHLHRIGFDRRQIVRHHEAPLRVARALLEVDRHVAEHLAERDLQAARESFDTFKQLITRFPESKYAPDAEARMTYLVASMARGEMLIARYYFQRGAYVAAANRAQEVVRKYDRAPAVEDALAILVHSYDKLGMTELRDDARRVLDRNFPNSEAMVRVTASDDRRWWQVWR